MNVRQFLMVSVAVLAAPTICQAQGRWDKFQQKLDEYRPKGKWIQQIKESLESESPADDKKKIAASPKHKPVAKPASQTQQDSSRRIPAQQASRRSILSTARNLPAGDVVLGIQIDPGFLPSRKLVVSEVDSASPAGKAGIRSGDQITAIGGIPTNNLKSLDGVLSSLNGGDQVVIEFVRNRKSEKTLVRFEKPVETATDSPASQAEPGAPELPPPPEMLDAPVMSPSNTSSEGLKSVLSAAASANPTSAGARREPTYFPAEAATPPVVGRGRREMQFADDVSAATPDQLRTRIHEQQQLIEQLQLQIQQLQLSNNSPVQDQIESESLILDPNSN